MSLRIVLFHRLKQGIAPQSLNKGAKGEAFFSWETCLRHLVFTIESDSLLEEPFGVTSSDRKYQRVQRFTDMEAYRFCLQTICGLNSQLKGETEVFGQFKKFLKSIEFPQDYFGKEMNNFFVSLTEDAKLIRKNHLNSFGSQSYGSFCRKLCKNISNVSIFGAGHLAKEIAPWLATKRDSLNIYCRSLEKANKEFYSNSNIHKKPYNKVNRESLSCDVSKELCFSNLKFKKLDKFDESFNGGAIIVAAPLSASVLHSLFVNKSIDLIIDLRDSSVSDSINLPVKIVNLQEFYKQIKDVKSNVNDVLKRAHGEVDRLALRWSNRIVVRPFGWDDLCG